MSTGTRRVLILAIIGVVFVAGLAISVVRRMPKEKTVTITGRITKLDVASRAASIQFVHPKSGKTMTADGQVPLDCDLQIDGKPARIEDLRVGDEGEVKGTLHRDYSVTASWVRVTRQPPTTTSAPTATGPSRPAASSAPATSQAAKGP